MRVPVRHDRTVYATQLSKPLKRPARLADIVQARLIREAPNPIQARHN